MGSKSRRRIRDAKYSEPPKRTSETPAKPDCQKLGCWGDWHNHIVIDKESR
jgi:hypothetical protein